jgi:23S rRNA (uracil1939-C5)-methyltransferase
LNNKKRIIIDIDIPVYGGGSIGRYKGKVVMIKGAVLPGETVEAVIVKEKKDYITASAGKIIQPSPDRVKPPCRYYGTCGGCHLQHAPYTIQVKLKEEILRDTIRRLAKIDLQLSAPIITNRPWHYRCRAQFKVSEGKIGFYRKSSTNLIDVDTCPLMREEINTSLTKVRSLLTCLNAGEIHISCGETAVAFIKMAETGKDFDGLASAFIGSGFSGLMVETDDQELLRYGKPYITLNLEEMKYTVSAISFFQSHWKLNRSMIRLIKDTLGHINGKRVLDLYSGAGNFSLPLAGDADVTAVEESPYAIEDGRRNLEINGIRNCRFVNSPAERYLTRERFDILILDPPRPGLSNQVVKNIHSLLPEQIVYISCDPATFSRDLKKLAWKYDIESVRMVDLFPQTFHIESLAFLQLR